jgi:glycosyltransferase involved in cell wall biosynthesis
MRLMFLLEDYTPDVFASTVRMREMIMSFSRNEGVEIRVVVYNPRESYEPFEAREGNISVKRYVRKYLPQPFYIVKHINPLALANWMSIIRKESRAFRPDLIVTTVPSTIPTIASYLVSRKPGLRHQIDFRDDYVSEDIAQYIIENYPTPCRAICRRMFHLFHRVFLDACRNALLISTVYREMIPDIDLLTGGRVPVLFIPNGVNVREFDEIKKSLSRETVLGTYHIPPARMSLIYVGVFGGWYRPEVIIGHLKRLKDGGRDINLIIVGDGPSKDRILEISRDNGMEQNLFILGKLPHREVVKLLMSSDFALYTLSMDFPKADRLQSVKVLEYMASELPIISISPDASIVSRIVREFGIGEVVSSSDPAALGSALEKLVDNRQRYQDKYRDVSGAFRAVYDRETNNRSLFQLIRQRLSYDSDPLPVSQQQYEAGLEI